MVGANMLCPAHVRRALFAADVDLRPVYRAMRCPGLVIHGDSDTVVTPEVGRVAADLMAQGRHLPYPGVGHAPFLEQPDRFASHLAAFTDGIRA
ncbi:alpha/beta hydrolase fold protein [Roseibacterium elongatum DSM 19469]|uniref:Alpha/beta hydrolase fold protein n=1 Tax=Roseicyclus elongatus DSM 19469 TaxID=1294273 RepID=W8S2B3_9RHOB|nr:alpha/beta hydrolase fold protein [Roseibacterium elongatum DSM 19469]